MADFTVSGATSPTECNGDYTYGGITQGYPYYKHNSQNYFISNVGWGWVISNAADAVIMGTTWYFCWESGTAPAGSYDNPGGPFYGTGNVTVTAAASAAAPVVSSITASSGTTAGGTSVTIAGTDFVTGATVTIGGNSCTGVSFGSSTSLTATTPAGSAGAKSVVVTNPDAQTSNTNITFTYTAPAPAPVITSIVPQSEYPYISINGSNFVDGTGGPNELTLIVNGVEHNAGAGDTFFVSSTLLYYAVSGYSIFSIVVHNPDGQESNSVDFAFVPPKSCGQVIH